MQFDLLIPFAFALLVLTSTMLLLSADIRLNIAAIGFQYLGVFALVAVTWPANLAAVKLVAGWLSISILGISRPQEHSSATSSPLFVPAWKFHLFSVAFVALVAASLATEVNRLIAQPNIFITGAALFLIGMGLLHNAVTRYPLQALLGILTFLSGFEILYSLVEVSALVAALLAIVNLGIAFVGAYLLATNTLEAGK